jgi:hypothetical protein
MRDQPLPVICGGCMARAQIDIYTSTCFGGVRFLPQGAAFSADWNGPCFPISGARTSTFAKKSENCTGNGIARRRLGRLDSFWRACVAKLRELA